MSVIMQKQVQVAQVTAEVQQPTHAVQAIKVTVTVKQVVILQEDIGVIKEAIQAVMNQVQVVQHAVLHRQQIVMMMRNVKTQEARGVKTREAQLFMTEHVITQDIPVQRMNAQQIIYPIVQVNLHAKMQAQIGASQQHIILQSFVQLHPVLITRAVQMFLDIAEQNHNVKV
jgi:hypothetical protein